MIPNHLILSDLCQKKHSVKIRTKRALLGKKGVKCCLLSTSDTFRVSCCFNPLFLLGFAGERTHAY